MIEQHELVVGFTGTGKTYHMVAEAYHGWPGPVLVWNPQAQELDTGSWIEVGLSDSLELMFKSARARLNYIPNADLRIARKELAAIANWLMTPGKVWDPPVLLILDEVDEQGPQGKLGTAPAKVAKRGRKHRVFGRFASQFPAEVTKEIVRNCAVHVLFPTPYGAEYFKGHGLPGELIEKTLAAAPPRSYMRWVVATRELKGPYTTLADGTERIVNAVR
jgi:hypothetical protein